VPPTNNIVTSPAPERNTSENYSPGAKGLSVALTLIAAGLRAHPVARKHKKPVVKEWQRPARPDPDGIYRSRIEIGGDHRQPFWHGHAHDETSVRAYWGRGAQLRARGVAVPTQACGIFALDPDSPEACEALLRIFEAHGGLPDTWTIHSPRGPKYIFRRPSFLSSENGNHTRVPELGGADVVFGQVVVWMPDGSRTWSGDPTNIAEFPGFLAEISEIFAPRRGPRAAQAPEPPRRETPDPDTCPSAMSDADRRRADAYVDAAIRGAYTRIAGMTEGHRATGAFSEGVRIGNLAATPWANITEDELFDALAPAVHVNGLVEDDGERKAKAHLRNGIHTGAANGPRPWPEHRDPPSAPPAPEDTDRCQTDAERFATALLTTFASEWLSTVHAAADAMTKETGRRVGMSRRDLVYRLGQKLAARMIAQERSFVVASLDMLTADLIAHRSTINNAVPLLEATGWFQVERGGVEDSGKPRATVWRLTKGFSANTDTSITPASLEALRVMVEDAENAVQPISVGARPGGRRVAETSRVVVGHAAHATRAALERAGTAGLDADELAERVGISPQAAGRHLSRWHEMGKATMCLVHEPGKAGRPRKRYFAAQEAETKASRATADAGAERIGRVAGLAAWRRYLVKEAAVAVRQGQVQTVRGALRILQGVALNRRWARYYPPPLREWAVAVTERANRAAVEAEALALAAVGW